MDPVPRQVQSDQPPEDGHGRGEEGEEVAGQVQVGEAGGQRTQGGRHQLFHPTRHYRQLKVYRCKESVSDLTKNVIDNVKPY